MQNMWQKKKELFVVTIGRIVGETRHNSILKSWFLFLDFYVMFRPMIRSCDVLTRSHCSPYLSGKADTFLQIQGSCLPGHVLGNLYWL